MKTEGQGPPDVVVDIAALHRIGHAVQLANAILAALEAEGYVIVHSDDLRMLIEGQKREKAP